ncbi:MinD/ParA family protein [Criibacterium bergeronii]|uniref:MinD/ParA family protein n=1 Tax=Criibacterium bergeronii TaxID=1871336 RepID=A0A371IMM4_9FIRM|nr:MinD/ParA family protein [Criibacterium bergeronii]MBS6062373.1 MinD/ParA family protein [Peptostreptococcaceae bacterium]RDY21721.1 MinD/ParA family protein [Criibacterium bergeronii]
MMQDQAQNLREVLSESSKVAVAGHQRTANFICISSGKGGVGKSNFTANLAKELSNRGKKVVIIDADLGLANIEILFGVVVKNNFFDVIKGDLGIKDIMTVVAPNLSIISGGSGILEMADVDEIKLKKVVTSLSYLNNVSDYVLIDTGAGISNVVTSFAQIASELIVITTTEPTSIADSYALIKVVSNKDRNKKISLVINKADNQKEANEVFTNINAVAEKFINKKLEYLGFIYEDPNVARAVKKQKPIIETAPQNRVSKCIVAICDKVTKEETTNQSQNFSNFIDKFKGLFRKV